MTTARRRLTAVPDNPARVVLYVRVSALFGRGGEDFHSPDVQLSAMRRVTAGLREVGEIKDIGETGRDFERAGIDRIRRMAERREIDAVAIYDVSRFGRNVRESLVFLAWLAEQGVTILSACEQVDTSTPAGRLMLTNMLAIAEYRSDEIGRNWAATIARRAGQGKQHGRRIGYLNVDGRLVPDPLLGPVVTKAWLDYAAGVKISRIARDVADGQGKSITTANLKVWFRRAVYLGHTVSNGEIVKRDTHLPLVDQRTWDLVQLRLARDRTTPPRALEVTWALVGIIHCAICGSRLQRQPGRSAKGVEVQRLCCGAGSNRGVAEPCRGIGFPVLARVEAEVLRQVAAYTRLLRTDDAARSEQLARRHTARADAATLRRRLTQLQDAGTKLTKAWALGDVPDAEYRPARAELATEADTLRARLSELGDVEVRQTPEQAATAAEAMLALWPDMDEGDRSLALRAVIKRIEVRRADRWREPEADRVTVTEWL
ncbi:recombinase family protein [Micromonospora sp. NPDC004704]